MIFHNLMTAINFNESFPVGGTIMDAGYLSVLFFPYLSSPLTIYGTSFFFFFMVHLFYSQDTLKDRTLDG